jgi:hypothetical protein
MRRIPKETLTMRPSQSFLLCGRIVFVVLVVLVLSGSVFAVGPVEKLVYRFQLPPDSASPQGGLVADPAGNLYGTTAGGVNDAGVVFELSPPATLGGLWTETILYRFGNGVGDGAKPSTTLILDKQGNLYGSTSNFPAGGRDTIFELSPPTTPGGTWTETILWTRSTSAQVKNGINLSGKLAMDAAGNFYAMASGGGNNGSGTVFELVRPKTAGAPWVQRVLYKFGAFINDGENPVGGLLLHNGVLYGATMHGGSHDGIVFQLVGKPGLWTENILYEFPGPNNPGTWGGLITDSAGNLYGTNPGAGIGYGMVYELSPPAVAGDPWVETTLHSFASIGEGRDPDSTLWRDKIGNLYGTTLSGVGDGFSTPSLGTVFKLKPPAVSGGTWTLITLHAFRGGLNDGANPYSELMQLNGAFYGTTFNGGEHCTPDIPCGTVYSIVP